MRIQGNSKFYRVSERDLDREADGSNWVMLDRINIIAPLLPQKIEKP